MRHRVKKIKFRFGKDHNKMLMRKLVWNFLQHGKITTTLPKAKALKSYIERLVYRAREKNEANKNVLLHHLVKKEWIEFMFEKVGPFFQNRTGGYVRIVKLFPRKSDGASMARLEWIESPVKHQRKENKTKKEIKKAKSNVESKSVKIKNKTKDDKTN